MTIAVINASNPGSTISLEADVYVDYRQGRASCFNGSERIKQCSSWHSWPYAMETEFFVYKKQGWEAVYKYQNVIILVNRDILEVFPLVRKLKLMGKKVAISFHEGVQDLITGSGVNGENVARRWKDLYDLVKEADFYINLFGQMGSFFEGWLGDDKVKYVSHGAPIDWNHGFAKPLSDRKYDILVGTRTFNQRLSRNTFITLGVVNKFAKLGYSVHLLSEDGDVSPLLKSIGMENITVHQGPMKWDDWLKFLSNFKMLVHHDNSSNLGQVCYDCAMVDVLPVGSTTWNNILIGTDDLANTNWLKMSIKSLFGEGDDLNEYYQRWQSLNVFKEKIHPDFVKEKLIEAFK